MTGSNRLTVKEAKALTSLVYEAARWWPTLSDKHSPVAHRAIEKVVFCFEAAARRPAAKMPDQLRSALHPGGRAVVEISDR
jgi:hypothetical protein